MTKIKLLDAAGSVGEPRVVGTAALTMLACVTLVFTARNEGKMTSYYPDPNLQDDVPIDQVRLLPSIKMALLVAGLKTVGDVRNTSDAMLLSFQNLGQSSVTRLRNELGRRDRA
jgi:DNA-directed RNA polymerase alpha subunit